LERLGDAENTPDPTKFREGLHIMAETGGARHSGLNHAVVIGCSGRVGNMVIYIAFQVL
jgi:Protein of unknown function (DUF3237)